MIATSATQTFLATDDASPLKGFFVRNISPRERWTPSQWAEKAPRIIPDNGINPEPGPMRFDRTPYMREVVDTLMAPGIELVVFPKCTQIGYTTCIEMLPGYFADMDPGSCMILGPDQAMTEEIIGQRIVPTIESTPALKTHLTGKPRDIKRAWITLDTMPIIGAWSTSPRRVASWSIRYLLADEIDKFPKFSEDEGDPILLAMKRTSNWLHRARTLLGSTPTVREGNVWRWYEACGDKRRYWVPCPHCKQYQNLDWTHVKWPKYDGLDRAEKGDRIKNEQSAYYQCRECKGSIHDGDKPKMLELGVWASKSQMVDVAGNLVGDRPKAKRVAFHLSSLYSPWLSFSDLAAEYVMAIGDPALMMDFRNSRLALPFEQQVNKTNKVMFADKLIKARNENWQPAMVPPWAACLLMAVDTQKDHFWVTIRAWGRGNKSRLIYWGRVAEFDDVERLLNSQFKVDRESGHAECLMAPQLCVIDSGGTADPVSGTSRTHQVYQFSLRDSGRIIPIRGTSQEKRQTQPVRITQITPKSPPGHDKLPPVGLHLVKTDWFKDLLMARIEAGEGTDGEWQLTECANNEEYLRGMASEHKVFDRKTNRYTWVPMTDGANNHSWDCEVYQLVAAEIAGVVHAPNEQTLERARSEAAKNKAEAQRTPSQANRLPHRRDSHGGGWVHRNRGRY